MNFTHGLILHLLWLIPLVALTLIVRSRKERKSLEQFADPALLPRIAPMVMGGKRFIKAALLLLALGALIFALAGPRWGSHFQEVSRKGVDIMLAVDVSTSMMVEDIKPTRLERARREIVDFLKVVTGDRIGLAAFAGAGFVQCPLTLDYAALEMFLGALEPGLIPVQGTDLGAAVDTALSAFDFKSETDKVIMLITDGEDNENRGLEAARRAAEKGVKIFVFGIGDPSGGPIPSLDGKGGFKKDAGGKLILSKLDEAGLQKMAAVTGGTYVRSVVGDLDLDILYFEGIKRRTEARDVKGGKIKVFEERFAYFAMIAFLALLIEGVIDDKRKQGAPSGSATTTLLVVFILLMTSVSARAAENPDELYRKGRFEEAAKAYNQGDMDNPKNLRYRYNRGCAAYQNGQYQEASAAFSSVLRRAEDDDLRFRSAYNLGNTAYKQQDLQSAVAYYKQALTYDSSSEDARHNLELALRTLERMKQEQKEKQNQESEQQDQQKQDNQKKEGESKDSDSKPDEKDKDKNEPSEKDKKDETSNENQASDQKQPPPREDSGGQKQPPSKDTPQNLAGDLKNTGDMPPLEKEEQEKEAAAAIDKKKADALLENMKEDQSRFMRFRIPKDKQGGVSTGKDW